MKRILLAALLVLAVTPMASASITDVSIVNLFPDGESTDRSTQVVGRFAADATTTIEGKLYVQTPNGTVIFAENESLTVPNNQPLEREFRVDANNLHDFGEYRFTVNQSNNNESDSFNLSVNPKPIVNIEIGDLVKDPQEKDLDYVHINVNPTVARSIGGEELKDANFTLYLIENDVNTPQGVEKRQVFTTTPGISNQTGDFEAAIDFQNLPEGTYEGVIKFNISTCPGCPKFGEMEATSIRVRNNSVNTMSVQLGSVLAVVLLAFLFAYLGINLSTRSKITSMMRVFFILLAPLFASVAVFTAADFAGVAGFGAANSYLNIAALGGFMAWFLFLVVIGLVWYPRESFQAALQGTDEFGADEV